VLTSTKTLSSRCEGATLRSASNLQHDRARCLRDAGPRWWLGLSGVVSILAGIVAFAYTGMTALVLLMFIAVWAIIIGVLQLYAAVQLRKVIENEWLLVLSGLLSIAFGAVLIAWPSTGALAVIWTIAWYAVLFGCLLVGLALRLKAFKRS
jgi:uncharacterized membrane protein HdeD (DUF308 family)